MLPTLFAVLHLGFENICTKIVAVHSGDVPEEDLTCSSSEAISKNINFILYKITILEIVIYMQQSR